MNALEIFPKTQYTMISWDLKVDDFTLDCARTKEEADEWIAMMNETKEIGDDIEFTCKPVLIDEDSGEEVTEENLRIYLLPQYDEIFKKQMGWN